MRIVLLFLTEQNPIHKDALVSNGYVNNPDCDIIIFPKNPSMVDAFWKPYLSKYKINEWDNLSNTIAILLMLDEVLKKDEVPDIFYICPEDLYPHKPFVLLNKINEETKTDLYVIKPTTFSLQSSPEFSDHPFIKIMLSNVRNILETIEPSPVLDMDKSQYKKYDEILSKTDYLKDLCYKKIFQESLETLPRPAKLENYIFLHILKQIYTKNQNITNAIYGRSAFQQDKFWNQYLSEPTKRNRLLKTNPENESLFDERNSVDFMMDTLPSFRKELVVPNKNAIIITLCKNIKNGYDYSPFIEAVKDNFDIYIFKCFKGISQLEKSLSSECVRVFTILPKYLNKNDKKMISDIFGNIYNYDNIYLVKDDEDPLKKLTSLNAPMNNVSNIDQKLYTTLEYGYVIKMITPESIYDNRYFMVERITDEELVLLERNGKLLTLELPLTDVMEINIVYIPELKGYIKQNNILVNSWINIEFIDKTTVKGKIVEAENNIIHLQIPNVGDIYIPVHYGLPKQIIKITKTIAPKIFIAEEQKEPELTNNVRRILEDAKEDEELGEIDVEVEDNSVNLFFSLEQQSNDLLENLLIPIEEKKRSLTVMKKLFNVVRRYVELRGKYMLFDNGIKRLEYPENPFLKSVEEGKSELFIPVTKNILVYKFAVNKKSFISLLTHLKLTNGNFFTYVDEEEVETNNEIDDIFIKKAGESFDSLFKLILYTPNELRKLSLSELNEVTKTFTNNLQIDTRYNKDNQLYDTSTKNRLIYLLSKHFDAYPLNINHPYIISHYLTRPISHLKYDLALRRNSYILDKSIYSKTPYFDFLFKIKTTLINSVNNKQNLFNDKIQILKNKEDTFKKYVNDFLPSIETMLTEYLDTSFMSYSDAIKILQYIDVDEYNDSIFNIIKKYVEKNINEFIAKEKQARQQNLQIKSKDKYNLPPLFTTSSLLEEYPLLNKDKYYSPSEIYYTALIDCYHFYALEYIKKFFDLQLINDSQIENFINEINTDFAEIMNEDEIIHKIYHTEQDKENTNYKKIILQDMIREGNNKRMNPIEFIYQELLRRNKLNGVTLDEFVEKINEILEKGLEHTNQEFKDADVIQYINEAITTYKIIQNNVALVEETNKKYRWDGQKWILFEDAIACIRKKIISLKGGNDEQCENKNRSQEYENKIKGIILDIQSELKRKEELQKLALDNPFNKRRQIYYINQKRLYDMKYNNQQIYYMNLELQKESNMIKVSPYKPLFDKIMKEQNLTNKYKAIQIFVKNYTKTITSELNWFLCIETGVKLVPKFLLILADAYLITNNYTDIIEKLCLDIGVLSDDGANFVDKHSGYIIKEISLNEDMGYNDKGFKNVFHSVVEKDEDEPVEITTDENGEENKFDIIDKYEEPVVKTEMEINIKNAILFLLTMMGIILVNKVETLEEIYELVTISFNDAYEQHRKKSDKESSRIKLQLYLFSVMSHCLIFAQTCEQEKIKFIVPYPGCKKTFDGYPINNDNREGIDYVACIIEEVKKKNTLWNVFVEKTASVKTSMSQKIYGFIKNYVYPLTSIQRKIFEAREKIKTIDITEKSAYSKWNLFSPRLEKMTISFDGIEHLSIQDKITLYSYSIQQKINEHISKQAPLRTNHFGNPFQINSCCDKNNNVFKYFAEKTGIDKEIKQIYELKKELYNQSTNLDFIYSYKNTKRQLAEISSIISETTIYSGIIKWFLLDENIPPPKKLEKHEIHKPENYKKTDTLEEKIIKLKENNVIVSMDDFLEIAKDVSTRNFPYMENKKKENEPVVNVTSNLIKLLDTGLERDIINYCNGERDRMINDIIRNKNITSKLNKSKLGNILKFYDLFKSEKKNLFLPENLEHHNFMNQILSNRINLLINVFPSMIMTSRQYFNDSLPKHWKLNNFHNKQILENIEKLYKPITVFYSNSSNKTQFNIIFNQIDLGEVKYITEKIKINNQNIKFMVYSYLYIKIIYSHLSVDNKVMNDYILQILSYFMQENKSLDYNAKVISMEVNLAKKHESEIKTTHLKEMGKELRRSENQLKNLKLGEWASGLSKSVYKYNPKEYENVLKEANKIKDSYAPAEIMEDFAPEDDTGEYNLRRMDDDELGQDLDGDEW
jgi:hypothetical protein